MTDAAASAWASDLVDALKPLDIRERPSLADGLDRDWRALADKPEPVLALVGDYNAGKTSLLRRILAEAGDAVPPELTVSAQPETFEVHEVRSMGCIWVDMP